MSTKPGATAARRVEHSRRRRSSGPTAAIRPSLTPTSARAGRRAGAVETVPPRITRSQAHPRAGRLAPSVDDDAVALAGRRGADLAVEDVLEHERRVALERRPEAAAAGRDVAEHVAAAQRSAAIGIGGSRRSPSAGARG